MMRVMRVRLRVMADGDGAVAVCLAAPEWLGGDALERFVFLVGEGEGRYGQDDAEMVGGLAVAELELLGLALGEGGRDRLGELVKATRAVYGLRGKLRALPLMRFSGYSRARAVGERKHDAARTAAQVDYRRLYRDG